MSWLVSALRGDASRTAERTCLCSDGVWDLLDKAYELFGVFPTLLERDFNLPPVAELLTEVQQIKQIQARWIPRGRSHEEQAQERKDGQRLSA